MLEQNQVKYQYNGSLPIVLTGHLQSGVYELNGNVSSQFISGLLLVLPFLKGDSKVIIKNKLESKPYVDMTVKIAKEFGINIYEEGNIYTIPGNQEVVAKEYYVEGDYSQAAFFLVANALGANLELVGLKRSKMQGDEAILDILGEFGVKFNEHFEAVERKLHPATVSLAQNPDLAPILGVLASSITGMTKLVDLERLAFKESNRILSTKDMLEACGVKVLADDKSLTIIGPTDYQVGSIKTCNDHRIVMSSAVLSLVCPYVLVDEIKPVNKSFPNFFTIYQNLGGVVNE